MLLGLVGIPSLGTATVFLVSKNNELLTTFESNMVLSVSHLILYTFALKFNFIIQIMEISRVFRKAEF